MQPALPRRACAARREAFSVFAVRVPMSSASNDVLPPYDQARFICTICHRCWDVAWIGKAKSAPLVRGFGDLIRLGRLAALHPLSRYPQGPAGTSGSSIVLFSSHSPLPRDIYSLKEAKARIQRGVLKTTGSGKALLLFSLRCSRHEFSDLWVKASRLGCSSLQNSPELSVLPPPRILAGSGGGESKAQPAG